MCARLWLELPCSGLSDPDWPTDSKQTLCKHVKSVPQTVQAYRQLSDNDAKLLSDNILRVITRTVTYCRKPWNLVKKASNTKKLKYMKDSKVCYSQSTLKAPAIWLLRGGGGYGHGARFIFSALYTLKDIFFHQVLPCKNFFPMKSVCRILIFFPEITHNPSKVKWLAPKQTPLGKRKKYPWLKLLLIGTECFTSSESKQDYVHKHSGTSALHKKASTVLILSSKLPLIHFHIYVSQFNKSSQNKLTSHLNFSENNAATKKSIQMRGQMTRPSQKTRDSAVVTLLSFYWETYQIKVTVVPLKKLKGGLCSEPLKSRVPSMWFLQKKA